MAAVETIKSIPWWKEPTKDQWLAWVAAWLGWTLDAFDFTIFLLIMLPISQEFAVPLTAVTAVFTLTLWMRLVGATASGWLADRIGRKKPLIDLDRRHGSLPEFKSAPTGSLAGRVWQRCANVLRFLTTSTTTGSSGT